ISPLGSIGWIAPCSVLSRWRGGRPVKVATRPPTWKLPISRTAIEGGVFMAGGARGGMRLSCRPGRRHDGNGRLADLLAQGRPQRFDPEVDLGDGQTRVEAERDLDEDHIAGAPRPDPMQAFEGAGMPGERPLDAGTDRLAGRSIDDVGDSRTQ